MQVDWSGGPSSLAESEACEGEKREHIRATGELSWGTHLPWGQANSQPPLSNYYRVLKTKQ